MKKVVSLALGVAMLLSIFATFSFGTFADTVDYSFNSQSTSDGYYNLVSKKDWDIAPGIVESEIVINNDLGTRRQVAHVMVADVTNEYVKVATSYTNMDTSVFATSNMLEQATAAEEVYGWNVVGAMNTCLSWYDGYPADHKSEPLGFMMIDGETVWDLTQKYGKLGFPTCVVINSDDRPTDMAKVEMKSITGVEDLTGYEEQVIPCSSGFIVKDGVNLYSTKDAHDAGNSNSAPRSVVGITADGKVIIMENDGRQTISAGMGMYECAEMMLDLGCVYACNCDGGGSSTFVSQRPGEDLTIVNSPSDGSPRETTNGILFVSTAPSDGQFAIAHISTDDKYYTPGSVVTFDALGTDLVGTTADIPEDVVWQIKESGMGTIENGVFTSNGTTGTVTAQMVYGGKVVGEASIEIVIPEIAFTTSMFAVKYGTSANLTVVATTNGGVNEVVLKPSDYTITCDNAAIGTIDGTTFTAVTEEYAPATAAGKKGTLTVTLNHGENIKGTATVAICREITETLYNWDDGLEGWNVWEIGKDTYAQRGDEYYVEAVTAENGEVLDGTGSMKLYTNQLSAKVFDGSKDYYQLCLYPETSKILNDVQSYGVWVYVNDEAYAHEFNFRYFIDANNDGIYDTVKSVTPYSSLTIYEKIEESGWVYMQIPVGGKTILIPGADIATRTDIASKLKTVPNYCRAIHILAYPHTSNAILQSGTVNGKYDYYFDNFTVDYAADVADRTAPVFGTITLLSENGSNDQTLTYGRTKTDSAFMPLAVTNTTDNVLDICANVSDAGDGLNGSTAKAYVDGKLVECTYSNGKISVSNIAVANGVHRVKFEICDRAGNKQIAVRLVNVASEVDASTVVVEPKDTTLDKLLCGSVYWMNIKATDIETIQSVNTVIDLNSSNHWELANMEVAEGFTASYTVNDSTNSATITLTRTGTNTLTGEAVIASLPIRIISFADDIKYPGLDEQTYWTTSTAHFWAQDLKVDVDFGEIEYVYGYEANTVGTFSNDSFSVSTEMFKPYNYMSAAELAASTGLHTHTVTNLEDKAATCLEGGYTGRTYCEVCGSVVDWGTATAKTGHKFVNGECEYCQEKAQGWVDGYYYVNGELVSGEIGELVYKDGKLFTGFRYKKVVTGEGEETTRKFYYYTDGVCASTPYTGLIPNGTVLYQQVGSIVLEGARYCMAGVCLSGWQLIDDEWYYFDETTYASVATLNNGKVTYEFDENGKLLSGKWYTSAAGTKYYYGPDCYRHEGGTGSNCIWAEIDGKNYAFNNLGYMYTGVSYLKGQGEMKLFVFAADGEYIGLYEEHYTGIKQVSDGSYFYLVDDVITPAGLIIIDNNYYYIRSNGQAATGAYYVYTTNGLMPRGTYTFDAEGKLPVPQKDGLISENGGIYYYVDGVLQTGAGLILIDDNYYYIRSNGQAATGSYYVYNTNGLMVRGYYTFDENGKMPYVAKDGLVSENGGIYYYVDGELQTGAGLILIGDNYYYIRSNGQAATGSYYVYNTNGLMVRGYYTFDANGKLPYVVKDGMVSENGGIYYYVDGVLQTGAGLILYEGNYYYIRSSGQAATGSYYVYNTNGLMARGTHTFDVNGVMITE